MEDDIRHEDDLCEEVEQYQNFLRSRITQFREQKGISEYRLSLELGKSGSYIRSITCGATLPSLKELFNIIVYFEISPAEFFEGMEDKKSLRAVVKGKLLDLDDEDLEKVSLFIGWIQK